jgi:hypothetical protein
MPDSIREASARGPFSPIELAWAAGFYDGEGNCTFIRSDKLRQDGTRGAGGQVRIQIGQVRPEPLERFHKAVGGLGTLNGPYPGRRKNESPIYQWMAVSCLAYTQIWNLLGPYLSAPKQEQFHEVWLRMRDHYATADVRRNDPRRLPPEPLL